MGLPRMEGNLARGVAVAFESFRESGDYDPSIDKALKSLLTPELYQVYKQVDEATSLSLSSLMLSLSDTIAVCEHKSCSETEQRAIVESLFDQLPCFIPWLARYAKNNDIADSFPKVIGVWLEMLAVEAGDQRKFPVLTTALQEAVTNPTKDSNLTYLREQIIGYVSMLMIQLMDPLVVR